MIKTYICDGKACSSDDGKHVPGCYMVGGNCCHTLDVGHALLYGKFDIPKTKFERMEDGETCFEMVEMKDLLAIINV